MQLGLGWRPWDGVDQRVRRKEGTRSAQTTPTTSQGRPTHPTFQEPPLSMERQTEVIQGGWGWECAKPPDRSAIQWANGIFQGEGGLSGVG